MNVEDKVNQEYWESNWEKDSASEKFYLIEQYMAINRKFNRLFKNHLKKEPQKILEIGCARGKRLIYFFREFGYDVYGVDYSEKGVELARSNLKKAGVSGTILHEDIFNTSLNDESFDIVFSMGLIEHFNNPSDIINAHLRLLKKGGTLIMSTPNFRGSLYLSLGNIFNKDKKIHETHNLNIMDKTAINEILRGKPVRIKLINYIGSIDLSLTGIFGKINSKLLRYCVHLINQSLGYATYLIPLPAYLSPYIVVVAEKTG